MKAKSTLPVLDVTKCVAIWPGVVAMVGLMVTALAQGQQNTAPTTVIVTSKITIQEAQKDLQVLGYEPGPADGAMSQKTQHALELFQHEYMPDPITKKLDKPTIDRLSSNAAAAIRDNRTGLQARPGSGCPVVVASADGKRNCYQASGYLSPDGKTIIQPYLIHKNSSGEYVSSQ